MTLDDLRTFVAVCRAGNITAVARELGCTQPAVAQHVARLERELGVSLLERQPRGVTPTEAGKVLYAGATDALGALDNSLRRVRSLERGDVGSLSVSTGPTTVRHFMQEAVVAFRQRFPNVALEFHPANSTRRCIDQLRSDGLDLAFITTGLDEPGIEQRAVQESRQALLVRADHGLAKRKRLHATQLRGMTFVGLRAYVSSASQLARELAEHGVVIHADTVVEDWDTAGMMVELGLGQAIMPSLHAHRLQERGGVVALLIDGLPPVRFGWAARRFSGLSPVAQHFMELVDGQLAQSEALPGCRAI